MGNNDQQQRREYDQRDYGPDVGLQIVPVTPTREDERRDRWHPGLGDVGDIIKNNRLPDITKKTPFLN